MRFSRYLPLPGIVLLWVAAALAQNPAVTVNVDVQANRHPISPLIYGVNLFESSDTAAILEDLNAPINRYGGNRASTYNWQLNSDNRGNDFYFESITDDAGAVPAARTDTFISTSKSGSAEPMVTVPMLDWVAKAGLNRPFPCSYPLSRFPDQDDSDGFDDPLVCGSGRNPDHSEITGNVISDDFVANTIDNQKSWMQHTLGTKGLAANGGLKYYILDNEPDLWFDTHRDVVPNAPHYLAHFQLLRDYAIMIKNQDMGALVAGPEVSSWLGYIYSPFDDQDGHKNNFVGPHVDHDAIGGDYMPWLLSQFKSYADANGGQRLLDIFTVHYYPQGGDNNSNTRSLWDPNFVDPSFIDDKIMLIPRMKQWVADNYPGTKIGITEYNWGTISNEDMTDNMGYAVTQADVLGIFGREGLDLATIFNAPPTGLPTYNAMKMYRNYDGMKSTFGDVSVTATVPDPDNVAAFAAQRTADSNVTIMVLNKFAAGSTPVTVNVANYAAASAVKVWQLSGAGTSIQNVADAAISNGSISLSLPQQSVTLLILSPQQQAPEPAATFSTNALNFGTQLVGSYTVGSTFTLTNSGNATLNISGLSLSGTGLVYITDCAASLAPGSACRLGIKPTAVGALNGTLTVTDNATNSPQTISISGTGRDIVISGARPTRSKRLSMQSSQPKR